MNSENIKILIIRLSALGDTIHTLPLLYALRQLYGKSSQIDWVVEDKSSEFIKNNPLINNVFIIPKNKSQTIFCRVKQFIKCLKEIRRTNYDIIIDVQQLFKSALWLFLAKGNRKITQDKGREFSFLAANEIIKTGRALFDVNYHVVQRNLDIARYLGAQATEIKFPMPKIPDTSTKAAKDLLKDTDKTKPIIIIAPATTWGNKHWLEDGWSGLIQIFSQRANIVVTGTVADKEKNERIIKNSNSKVTNLTGKTTLNELVEIIKMSDIVITPDSGTAHIAWAVDKPNVIALFFSTSAKRTGPFGKKYFSLQASTPCSPCMKRKCKFKHNKENCKREINFNKIINIVNKLLTTL